MLSSSSSTTSTVQNKGSVAACGIKKLLMKKCIDYMLQELVPTDTHVL